MLNNLQKSYRDEILGTIYSIYGLKTKELSLIILVVRHSSININLFALK